MTYTHERTDRLPLPPDVARCEPSEECHVRANCARYQATLPRHGGSRADFSLPAQGGTAMCPGYIDARSLRKAAMPAPAPRPAVRGIA